MKTTLLLSLCLAGVALADFSSWTNRDGKSADLDLVKVVDKDGEKAGEFKLRNGRSVTLKASDLSEADAKRLAEWKSPTEVAAPEVPKASVFDKILEGNLVRLSGKSFKRCGDATKPAKYYLFYYTASWCAPCHAFTPSLVEFYDKNKPDNNDFEIVLVTSDSDEKAMEGYAAEMKMGWPQLKLAKVEKFKSEFKHPGTGIPNLVLTDLEGNILKSSYEGKDYKGPDYVMDYLGTLLKK